MDLLDLYRLGSALVDVSRRAMVPPNVQFDFGSGGAVLMARLFEREEGGTITQLTELTGFAQSRVSTVVAHLHSLGWVTTETDPRDRRRTVVRLTTGVRRGIGRAFAQPATGALDELLEGLAAAERSHVTDALERLARLLRDRADAVVPIPSTAAGRRRSRRPGSRSPTLDRPVGASRG